MERGIAVVMPAVGRSFCLNLPNGCRYFDFVTCELPSVIEELLPVSAAREDQFIAGLSMGGYGAFFVDLTLPERYAAAASLSGCLNVADFGPQWFLPGEFESIFPAKELAGSEYDLCLLLANTAASGRAPKLYQCCGAEDDLLKQNREFRACASKLPVDITYEEDNGTHNWAYWRSKIEGLLHWLPVKG